MVLVDVSESVISVVSVLDDYPVNQHLKKELDPMRLSISILPVDFSEDADPEHEEDWRARDDQGS
jgi:hypothetical protein